MRLPGLAAAETAMAEVATWPSPAVNVTRRRSPVRRMILSFAAAVANVAPAAASAHIYGDAPTRPVLP